MAAIDQHAEPDAFRTPQVEKAVHGSANRASGVEHVIDNHQILVVNREIDFIGMKYRLRAYGREVVAIERDIESADRNFDACWAVDCFRQALRQSDAAAPHADY